MVDGELEVVPILPPTIKEFSWRKLRDYVANPPNYSKLKKDQLAESTSLTEDEKLQLQAEIAEANREAEELRNSRIEAAVAAEKRNRQIREDTGKKDSNSSTSTKPAAPENNASSDEVQLADAKLSESDRREIIKEQFKQLGLTKEKMVQAIEKRGGSGAKLADLSMEQLLDLQKSLWNVLTKRDLEKK